MATARKRVRVCSDAVLVGVLFHPDSQPRRAGAPNGIQLRPLLSFACVAPTVPLGH